MLNGALLRLYLSREGDSRNWWNLLVWCQSDLSCVERICCTGCSFCALCSVLWTTYFSRSASQFSIEDMPWHARSVHPDHTTCITSFSLHQHSFKASIISSVQILQIKYLFLHSHVETLEGQLVHNVVSIVPSHEIVDSRGIGWLC